MELDKLIAELKACDAKLDALTSQRELTAEQEAEGDKLLGERKQICSAIKRIQDKAVRDEDRARIEAGLARTVPAAGTNRATAPASSSRADDGSGVQVIGTSLEETDESIDLRLTDDPTAQRRLAYRSLRRQNARLLQASGYGPWNEFRSASDFLSAVREAAVAPARNEGRLMDRMNKHYAAVLGMSEGIGSDGGYMVMPEYAMGIIDRVYQNSLWSQCDGYTVSGNNMTFFANAETSRATGSRHGGLRSYYMSEAGSITSSKPTLREVTLKLIKAGVLVYMTEELMMDGGGALQQYTANKVGQEFNFLQGDAVINGTGAGQPLGILNDPSLVSVAKSSGQSASTILAENVLAMYSRAYAPGLPRSQWLINQDIQPQLDQMTIAVGTGGAPLFVPPGGLSAGPYGTLRGLRLSPVEFAATIGTQGDIALVDLSQYLTINKGGVAQAVSLHVQFLTQQAAFLWTLRYQGRSWLTSPITPYKGTANTQASFVVLDSRA